MIRMKRDTSSWVGALTRILRQRDLTASVTLEELLQHKMSLQDELYFSMVLLRECCASLDNLSTSFSTKTVFMQNNELLFLCLFTPKYLIYMIDYVAYFLPLKTCLNCICAKQWAYFLVSFYSKVPHLHDWFSSFLSPSLVLYCNCHHTAAGFILP